MADAVILVKWSVGNDAKLAPLRKLAKKLDDENFAVPMKRVAVESWAEIDDTFKTESSPDGVKWKRLSKIYRAFKKKIGKERILVITGVMRKSFVSRAGGSGGRGTRFNLTKNRLRIGTSLTRAVVHQKGSRKKNIPKRPMLGISKAFERIILAIFKDWIDTELER